MHIQLLGTVRVRAVKPVPALISEISGQMRLVGNSSKTDYILLEEQSWKILCFE